MVGNSCYENYEIEDEPTLIYAIYNTNHLNDEVEIIEEDEKTEEIEELEYCEIDDDTLGGLVKSINELNKEFVTAINGLSKAVKGLKGKSE